MGIPDYLTCLLRNLCLGQEATDRILYGTTDWFKIEKGVWQGCLLSSCLFNLYTEHIMRNARLDDLQVGIKTGSRNSNNFWYVGDTTLMEEKELKHLLMRVKKSEKPSLKLHIQRRQWHPTPVHLPGKSHGRRSLVGCCLWGRTESDTTEVT